MGHKDWSKACEAYDAAFPGFRKNWDANKDRREARLRAGLPAAAAGSAPGRHTAPTARLQPGVAATRRTRPAAAAAMRRPAAAAAKRKPAAATARTMPAAATASPLPSPPNAAGAPDKVQRRISTRRSQALAAASLFCSDPLLPCPASGPVWLGVAVLPLIFFPLRGSFLLPSPLLLGFSL